MGEEGICEFRRDSAWVSGELFICLTYARCCPFTLCLVRLLRPILHGGQDGFQDREFQTCSLAEALVVAVGHP